jgi:hypothetical protein
MHYNFAKIHKTLRVTPAMEAGVSRGVWSIEQIVGLLDRRSAVAALIWGGGMERWRWVFLVVFSLIAVALYLLTRAQVTDGHDSTSV